jgi:hypothetical protein
MTRAPQTGAILLEEAQAQKHVTANEAILDLDALVQIGVDDRDLTQAPASPVEGDRHIMAGTGGAWSGGTLSDGTTAVAAGDVAHFRDGAWVFYRPRPGWQAWVADEGEVVLFDGGQSSSGWVRLLDSLSPTLLGVNATADTTNRLAVKSRAILVAWEGAVAGDVQAKLVKEAAGATASFLFQTAWSGRAEFGLIGSDDFTLKVSTDGSAWKTGMTVDRVTGKATFGDAITVGTSIELSRGANDDPESVGIGSGTLGAVTTGSSNLAIGAEAGDAITEGTLNLLIGYQAGSAITTGSENTCIGRTSGLALTDGDKNTFLGPRTGEKVTGNRNVALGYLAAFALQGGNRNTALGHGAMLSTTPAGVNNATAVGADTEVTGSNQVQLGNSSTNTYAYGAVQDRSDARDKADVRDTVLGLDFVLRLRPVDFRWDYREDYSRPADVTEDEWTLPAPGAMKRSRYHHGLIAQEVAQVIAELGVDFGGYQDHTINGGQDVQTIGYAELIAPLVKAVQELDARNRKLEARVAAIEPRG